ncbi:MAG: ABC-2 transporter permease [Lachnospiraceae bacterium]|nr:ABC-2 transporter permease [Lachnospiraceae bacterium]MBR6150088.1 ABC-2 transporter permease [Lachnospiraceae bacterium]
MKGLIFRELYLARKNLLSCSAIFLLFYGISCLTGLSLRFGNIAKYASPETREVLRTMLPGCLFACAAILIVTAGEATFQVCTKDLETPWLRYALASPMGIRRYVGAKYLSYLLLTGSALLISALSHLACLALWGFSVSTRFLLFYLFLSCFSLLFMTVLLPLIFLFQNGIVINLLAAVPLFGGVILFCIYAIKIGSKNDIPDFISYLNVVWYPLFARLSGGLSKPAVWILLCTLITALFTGSYFLSVKILNKLRVKKGGSPKAKLSDTSKKSMMKDSRKEAAK